MSIISLDLLLGTPRLQRRIKAELALLERDLEVARDNTRTLRAGVAQKATSLPALAAALAAGFVVTKVARMPRRPAAARDHESTDDHEGSAALNAATSLAWQFVMPMLMNWVQERFAPKERVPAEEPEVSEGFSTEP